MYIKNPGPFAESKKIDVVTTGPKQEKKIDVVTTGPKQEKIWIAMESGKYDILSFLMFWVTLYIFTV